MATSGASSGMSLSLLGATMSFTVCSMGMMVFNKLAVRALPLACSLVALQMAFTVLCMVVFCWKSLHVGSMSDLLRWIRVVPFFVGMLLTSMFALKDAPMSLVITFRALSPMFTLGVERFFPNPTTVGPGTVAALLFMCIGAGVYAQGLDRSDQQSFYAIGWVALNTALACIERLLQRLMLSKDQAPADVSKTAASLLNNFFGMIPMMAIAFALKEHEQYEKVFKAMSHLDMFWVLASCVVGVGISFCAIWAQSMISATSMLVLTNSNKFAVILIEIFLIPEKHKLSITQFLGAVGAILATIMYARMRDAEEAAKKAAKEADKVPQVTSETTPLIQKKA
eukprot:TRINITY_DN26808_c0_g1_i1.p2 TRINITY_DN26808_c0_g1~~TRINITY_DN26808_c0_g1_i1.p2  ORF type:complete len:367 (-),score=99.36 TRINITY_DN26808_c0_g1_i1:215-1231(-)